MKHANDVHRNKKREMNRWRVCKRLEKEWKNIYERWWTQQQRRSCLCVRSDVFHCIRAHFILRSSFVFFAVVCLLQMAGTILRQTKRRSSERDKKKEEENRWAFVKCSRVQLKSFRPIAFAHKSEKRIQRHRRTIAESKMNSQAEVNAFRCKLTENES